MTLREIKGFLEASSRKNITDQISLIISTSLASSSNGKAIKKAIKELEKSLEEADK